MKRQEFKEFIKDIDQDSLTYFIDEYFNDNPKYLEKFTRKQIEIMEYLLCSE